MHHVHVLSRGHNRRKRVSNVSMPCIVNLCAESHMRGILIMDMYLFGDVCIHAFGNGHMSVIGLPSASISMHIYEGHCHV